jgi:hypothetical protein
MAAVHAIAPTRAPQPHDLARARLREAMGAYAAARGFTALHQESAAVFGQLVRENRAEAARDGWIG